MAEFTASPDVSGFAPPNQLFNYANAVGAAQGPQSNQLDTGQQIDLSNANQAQVNQAAAGLLSGFPDEASRAAAYPKVIGMLQSQGYALHAPSQYPGEGVLRSMVNQSIPASDQYKLGLITSPGQQANFNAVFGPGSTGSTGAPGTTTGPQRRLRCPSLRAALAGLVRAPRRRPRGCRITRRRRRNTAFRWTC